MSILCKHRDIDGASLIRMLALTAERDAKLSLQDQAPERPKMEEQGKPFFPRLVKLLGYGAVMGAAYIFVQAMRGLLWRG